MDLAVRCTHLSADATVTLTYRSIAQLRLTLDTSSKHNSASPFDENGNPWPPVFPPNMPDMRDVISSYGPVSLLLGFNHIFYNGVRLIWDASVPADTWPFGSVVELTVDCVSVHPFHLHSYPIQVIRDCDGYTDGEYYDTILTSSPACVVRVYTAVVGGFTPMHCHFLRHEDLGAMIWVEVEGGPDIPPTDVCTLLPQ
jgi:FtsP/CotA-like multicopper oxidase with cupredoxin domain